MSLIALRTRVWRISNFPQNRQFGTHISESTASASGWAGRNGASAELSGDLATLSSSVAARVIELHQNRVPMTTS